VIVIAVEAAVTGLVVGLALPGGVALVPYLVVLTLIAGISRGVFGVSAVVLVQFLTIALVAATWDLDLRAQELLRLLSPWLLTGIGVGLLGAWLRQAKMSMSVDRDTSYESAHRLLTQLRTVAKRLSSGLDSARIANDIRCEADGAMAAMAVAVYIRTNGGVLSPLSYSAEVAQGSLSTEHPLIDACWTEMEPVDGPAYDPPDSHLTALPLRVGARMIGVVFVQSLGRLSREARTSLMEALDAHSLRLDTALTFDEVRSIATVEERHRLAREIHDGIAQEIAGIGYLVDDLISRSESGHQRRGLMSLREELSRVVSELRLSIFDLRSEVSREAGLGAALSEYVRRVGTRSNMTVHLSLDEAPTRLRAETEAELLRIAQEAITNARKHSGAENLWVDCHVRPPFARIEVSDDGAGLQQGRPDSYGLRIMKERAQRLGADLYIDFSSRRQSSQRGTLVRVTLGAEHHLPPGSQANLASDSEQ
jgi:signal transduction histidine kinase